MFEVRSDGFFTSTEWRTWFGGKIGGDQNADNGRNGKGTGSDSLASGVLFACNDLWSWGQILVHMSS